MAHDDADDDDRRGRASEPAVDEDDAGVEDRADAVPAIEEDERAPEDSDELGLGAIDPLAWGYAGEDDDALVARILGEPPPPPQRINERWVLLRRLGRGGMGEVHEAWDLTLKRNVALKFLHPGRAQDVEAARVRLAREAEAMAQIPKHPHVAHVYDWGTAGERVFLVMEYVDGSTLQAWQRGERAAGEIRAAYVQAGRGLATIHRAGLVHRDFKPANVFVTVDEVGNVHVTVGDLGLAYATEDSAERPPGVDAESALHPATPLTATGAQLGTVQYMAPEQLRGEKAGARSDQFAFCVSLYEALCGQRPFDAAEGSVPALLDAMARGMPAARQRNGKPLPGYIERVLRRGLALSPADRFPDMEALLVALTPPPRRAWPWLAAGVVGLAALAFAWMSAGREPLQPCEDVAAAELAGVWDEAAWRTLDARIHAAGGGSSLARAWEALRDALAHQGNAWKEHQTEVCKAKRQGVLAAATREAHEARTQCQDLVRLELQQVSARWLGPGRELPDDPKVALFSDAVALWLQPACSIENVELMAPSQGDGETITDARREELAELGKLLVEVELHERRGEYPDAAARGREAVALAEMLEVPLLAEARYGLGRVLTHMPGGNDEASELLASAAHLAAKHRMSMLMVDIMLFWSKHASVDLDDAPLARVWSAIAYYDMLPFGEAESHRLWRAEHEEALGLIASREGDEQTAIAHHQAALAIRADILGETAAKFLRSKSLNNLANAERAAGKREAALMHYQEALALREEVLGPDHPLVGKVLFNLGLIAAEQEDYEVAAGYLERALEIEDALPAPRIHRLLSRLMAVSAVRLAQYRGARDAGEPGDATGYLDRAVAHATRIHELHRRLAKEQPEVMHERGRIYEHVFLGALHEARGELEAALEEFRAALAVHEQIRSETKCGPHAQDMYRKDLVSAASLLCRLGAAGEARALVEEALSPPRACEDDITDEIRARIREELPRPACRP